MAERGEYRAIHSALIDDPDFQALSSDAKLTLFILKLCLGPSGIDVLYSATIPERTGLSSGRVSKAIRELHEGDWIRSERNVFWIRNGLRYEPSLALSNGKHVKGIQRHLRGLPKLEIIKEYMAYYGIPRIWEPESQVDPFDSHCDTHSDSLAIQGRREEGKREEGRGKEQDADASLSESAAPAADRKPSRRQQVQEVFEHWRLRSGKQKASLTAERRAKIDARLKMFPVEDLKQAIDRAHENPFYLGDNDRGEYYGDIITIFKSDTTTERHRDWIPESGNGNGKHSESPVTFSDDFMAMARSRS